MARGRKQEIGRRGVGPVEVVEDEHQRMRLGGLGEEVDVLLKHLLLAGRAAFFAVVPVMLFYDRGRLEAGLENAADDGHDVHPREGEAAHQLGHLLAATGAIVGDDLLEELGPGLERFDLPHVLPEERRRALGDDDQGRVRTAAPQKLFLDVLEDGGLADPRLARDEDDVLLVLHGTRSVDVIEDCAKLYVATNHAGHVSGFVAPRSMALRAPVQ